MNKKVSITASQTPLKLIFNQISDQTSCIFSYSNIDDQQLISLMADNISLKKALNRIKEETNVDFKVKGK